MPLRLILHTWCNVTKHQSSIKSKANTYNVKHVGKMNAFSTEVRRKRGLISQKSVAVIMFGDTCIERVVVLKQALYYYSDSAHRIFLTPYKKRLYTPVLMSLKFTQHFQRLLSCILSAFRSAVLFQQAYSIPVPSGKGP